MRIAVYKRQVLPALLSRYESWWATLFGCLYLKANQTAALQTIYPYFLKKSKKEAVTMAFVRFLLIFASVYAALCRQLTNIEIE